MSDSVIRKEKSLKPWHVSLFRYLWHEKLTRVYNSSARVSMCQDVNVWMVDVLMYIWTVYWVNAYDVKVFRSEHYKNALQTKINIKINKLWTTRTHAYFSVGDLFCLFLEFDFCQFCVVMRFFRPRHKGQWPQTSKDFLSQIVSITFIFLS